MTVILDRQAKQRYTDGKESRNTRRRKLYQWKKEQGTLPTKARPWTDLAKEIHGEIMSGIDHSYLQKCENCKGRGMAGEYPKWKECNFCAGQGYKMKAS